MKLFTGSFVVGRCPAVWLALCITLVAGCAARRPAPDSPKVAGGKEELTAALQSLSNTVNAAEANLLAVTAFDYSLDLGEKYRAVRPAIFHNILVNTGFKDRGLCYQWADDLEEKLASLDLKTLQLHRGCARLGKPNEHSAVVVTADGQAFDDGIVLDAWRNSGQLYWSKVKKDRYRWIRVEVVTNAEPVIEASGKVR